MKKLIIIFLLSFIASYSFAQLDTLYPSPPQNLGAKNVLVRDTGGLVVRQMFLAPIYTDTTIANTANPYTRSYVGSVIYTQDKQAYWFRQDIPRKWVLMGSSGGNNNTDTIYTEIPIAVKIDSLGRHIIYFLRPNGLYGGGIVTVDSCMTLDITPPTIVVNYKQYTGLQTIGVVVQPADPSLPRIDRVVMDTNLNIIVIEGMPSATPVPPEYNSFSQVSLAEIPVGADITCLGNAEIIFDGIADFAGQWTITTTGTGVTSFVNTANPYHLTQASYTVTYSNGYQIIYTKPSGTDTVKATSVLKGFITVVGNFTNQIIGQWYNGSTAVSNQLLLNSYFNVNDSNNYQIFSPQLSAWSWPGGTVYNKLILSFGGSDNSGSNGVYLDWLQIQTGIGNAGNKQYQDSSSIVNNHLTDWYNGIPITRQAVGGGGSQGLQDVINVNNQFNKEDTIDLNSNTLAILNGPVSIGTGINPAFTFEVSNPIGNPPLTTNADGTNSHFGADDGAGNVSDMDMNASIGSGEVQFVLFSKAAASPRGVQIIGDGIAQTITHDADTSKFNGIMVYRTPLSGSATDSVLTIGTDGKVNMRDAASFSSSVPINTLLAATGANTIDNTNYQQEWQWNTLTDKGLKLTSNSTLSNNNSTLLYVSVTGINATGADTYAAQFSNSHYDVAGTTYGVYSRADNGGGASYGVYGISGAVSGTGVSGIATSTNGIGIFGLGGSGGFGGYFQAEGGTAVNGISDIVAGNFSGNGTSGNNPIGLTASSGGGTPTISTAATFIATDGVSGNYAILVPPNSGIVGIGTSTPNSTIQIVGSLALNYLAISSTYTILNNDYTINCTSGTFTVILPTAVGITGRIYVIKNSGAGIITLDGDGSETIDGSTTQPISTLTSLTVQSTNSGWIIL